MNEDIIFKWNWENDRESIGKCIWKNKWVKVKYHCSLFKQYKNLTTLLEMF